VTPHPRSYIFVSYNHSATTSIYTLSLHDALPICQYGRQHGCGRDCGAGQICHRFVCRSCGHVYHSSCFGGRVWPESVCLFEKGRSEEHTSELQSRFDLVCRLLLEKKKGNKEKYTD